MPDHITCSVSLEEFLEKVMLVVIGVKTKIGIGLTLTV